MNEANLLNDQTRLPVALVVARPPPTGGGRGLVLAGVVAGTRFACATRSCTPIRSGPDGEHLLWQGFDVALRREQAGDYALNLGSPTPSIFVLCRRNGTDLEPEAVTVSLDEAQGLDSTELRSAEWEVLRAPLPPEIGRWMAEFVERHYEPPRRGKGRRRDGDYERSGRGRRNRTGAGP